MSNQLRHRLNQLAESPGSACLRDIRHGIEKESLRVNPQGQIAQTPHPPGLGSPLTHPSITTDFSEALLEFITPAFPSPAESLAFLENLHAFLFMHLPAEELLWTSSMPCLLGADEDIPIARYGSSNIGKLKTLYREGLCHRYGRAMQTIAGIHYNFSLPDAFWTCYCRLLNSDLPLQDFKTEQYFNLIRNFRRHAWLLLYLFGASPAVCGSFLRNQRRHGLEAFDESTLYAPSGTSLRMGDLGYTSAAQANLHIRCNSLQEYAEDLTKAIQTPYPPYQKFSPSGGAHRQINANILQIENEFYGAIRPKREVPSGARPIDILTQQGVEYVEVRCLDLNPFLPLGIDAEQSLFMDSFLLHCLLQESPPSDLAEYREIEANFKAVVNRGRAPDLHLHRGGKAIPRRDWAAEILQETMAVAQALDAARQHQAHTQAAAAQQDKVADSEKTPSAQVIRAMEEGKASYFAFAMERSQASSAHFRSLSLPQATLDALREVSRESDRKRLAIEQGDIIDFDAFLAQINAH